MGLREHLLERLVRIEAGWLAGFRQGGFRGRAAKRFLTGRGGAAGAGVRARGRQPGDPPRRPAVSQEEGEDGGDGSSDDGEVDGDRPGAAPGRWAGGGHAAAGAWRDDRDVVPGAVDGELDGWPSGRRRGGGLWCMVVFHVPSGAGEAAVPAVRGRVRVAHAALIGSAVGAPWLVPKSAGYFRRSAACMILVSVTHVTPAGLDGRESGPVVGGLVEVLGVLAGPRERAWLAGATRGARRPG